MRLLKYLYLLLFFLLPFSVDDVSLGFGIMLPGEPLQLLIAALLLFNAPQLIAAVRPYVTNPLFIFINLYLAWSWLDCLFAENTVISAKYTFIETLHWLVFGLGMFLMLGKYPKLVLYLFAAYCLAFVPMLLRGWYHAAELNFVISFSLAALWPFYNDHTLYGACIAFLLPFALYFTIRPVKITAIYNTRIPAFALAALLCIGLFMSFSRAAWLSVLVAGVLTAAIYLSGNNVKKMLYAIAASFVVLLSVTAAFSYYAQKKEMVKNTTVSNQFLSAFNWTYDVANRERLNRYKCALRMIAERPVTGWGNNGFKYNYTSYQKPEDMTRISHANPVGIKRKGTGGNSHSEYLEMFVDLGLPGFLLWLCIVGCSLIMALKIYVRRQNLFFLFVFFALLTAWLHLLVNNLMHDDKLSGMVWVCMAAVMWRSAGVPKVEEEGFN